MIITVILSYDGAGSLLSPLREVDIDLSLSSDHMQVHRSRNTPTPLGTAALVLAQGLKNL